ncbi:hypothetical protein GCK72_021373 [Caenorhabditis remanei]|uniref:F-box domain-containing protein n=1 Tax=Caenorhabditis remanei TaxID=31234 RepID=A0A6A5GKE7_CAERE|nr:hypothetical protein GCK72_021373 [Caenorhabditis remanei]KAF1754809.1 hypothetical protein GCK72_021373 [Caenorhabditis remanei]
MSPSFLEIPDVPMEMIMNNLDYFAVQSVRKTCWDLRNFIDDKKPDTCMKRIDFVETSDTSVRLHICPSSFSPEDSYIDLRYEKLENGCKIWVITGDSDEWKTKIVENLNFLDAALYDFKVALNTQKSIFEKITVSGEIFFEKFEEIMKSQKAFATESIEIHVNSLEHARQILQNTDPKYLKEINIRPQEPTNIIEYAELKSSKNIHNFSHFATTSIQLSNLDVETLRAIKENFLRLRDYDKLLYVYNVDAAQENLSIEAFGAGFQKSSWPPEETEQNWFFNVPGNNERVLKVYNKNICFQFHFVDKCEVPEGYVILD